MKHMEKMKAVIAVLAALCLLCAVAAFFLPNAQGMVLSYLAMALATAVAVLCFAGLAMLHHSNGSAA